MKDIGGYFNFHLEKKFPIYHEGIYLNSGRSCFEYICETINIKKIWFPSYICSSLFSVINKLNTEVSFYEVDSQLKPVLNFRELNDSDEKILIVNYFGVNDELLEHYSKYKKNIIWDLSQSFFCKTNNEVLAFYSPRKFFGVPDGGILVGLEDGYKQLRLNQSTSSRECLHLLLRIDSGAKAGFKIYQKNEERFSKEGMKSMSNITYNILQTVDYEKARKKRSTNYKYLLHKFECLNSLKLNSNCTPMIYPLFLNPQMATKLREHLLKKNIFIPVYWKGIENWVPKKSNGIEISNKLLPIPIDHRYDLTDMKRIVKEIFNII